MKKRYFVAGGAVMLVIAATIITVVLRPEEPTGCKKAVATVQNDYRFTDGTAVSDIVGVTQCLLGTQFTTIVVTDRQPCTYDNKTQDVSAFDRTIFCDEGLLIPLLSANGLQKRPASVRWWGIGAAAANGEFLTESILTCVGGYVTTHLPGFGERRQEHLDHLSAELPPDAMEWAMTGVELYEQGKPIRACANLVHATT